MHASIAFFASFVCLTLLTVSPALAQSRQGAPIVFAGQGGQGGTYVTASADAALAGGDERSYGYGRSAPRQGAVIDIRRIADTRPPGAAEAPRTAPEPAHQGADWLEQERVGPPYEANGRWYAPTPEPGYSETGVASWYGPQFHGRATASGEVFDQEALTAAHPTLPIPSLVQVTNLENGREAIVRVNDRGPFVGERLIDLSRRAAEVLGFEAQGHARVHVRYLGPAPRRVGRDGDANAAAPAPALAAASGPLALTIAPETPAYQAPVESEPATLAGGYFVQVGAFGDLSNAHAARARASAAGPVQVDTRQTASGGELFRVRVGPFASAEEASVARQTLADLGYYDTILASR